MRRVKYPISENAYKHLKSLGDKHLQYQTFLKEYCDICTLMGYGVYGMGEIYKEGNKFYIDITTGSTCD